MTRYARLCAMRRTLMHTEGRDVSAALARVDALIRRIRNSDAFRGYHAGPRPSPFWRWYVRG